MSVAYEQHSGPWTVEDVLALPEDRRYRFELLDEALVMSPAPGLRHQDASFLLCAAMRAAARAAGAPVHIFEAVNVQLPSGLVVPDLVVVDAAAAKSGEVSVDAEAVQLVVELVSPGNTRQDRMVKPLLYAEAAIPTYWRFEFDPAPRVVVSDLESGRYVETLTAHAGRTTELVYPFPFRIDPADMVQL